MQRIGTEKIMREKGHLYYVGANGQVYKVARGKKGSKAQVSKLAVKREPGFLYFVDKEGYVARTPMLHGKAKMKVKA